VGEAVINPKLDAPLACAVETLSNLIYTN